jgi:hypothetical protein
MKLRQYEKLTISRIRAHSDILRSLSDEELADLYHQWSETFYSAGWLIDSNESLNAFVNWATTPPYLWKKNT